MNESMDFVFSRDELFPIADAHREKFQTADPFPHIVIDNFLPPEVLEPVLREFPEPGDAEWQQYDNGREVKLALADSERMGPITRHLLAEFNSSPFVDFIERLTGIQGIVRLTLISSVGDCIKSAREASLRCTPTSITTHD
ncbi:hypothetical protein MAUB1S_02025 [Mycolicibacterium aubagnense]